MEFYSTVGLAVVVIDILYSDYIGLVFDDLDQTVQLIDLDYVD